MGPARAVTEPRPPAISGRRKSRARRRSAGGLAEGFAHWRNPLAVTSLRVRCRGSRIAALASGATGGGAAGTPCIGRLSVSGTRALDARRLAPRLPAHAYCGRTVSATVASKRSRRRTRSKAWCGASERDQWGRGRHTGAGRHGAADDVGQLWRGGRMARSVRPGLRNECRPLAGPGDGAPGGWWAPCCPLK